MLEGEPGASALKRVDLHTLASVVPNTSFALRATVLAVQTSTAAEWTEDLAALVATAPPAAVARSAHEAWWASFWARSHIEINATRWPALPAAGNDAGFKTSQMYAITRYTQAIQSRKTMWPIKFNGMAFIAQMGNNGEADARDWGSCNWWQNTRLPYGAMLAAGDYDTFETILKYKLNQEAMLSQRTTLHRSRSATECVEGNATPAVERAVIVCLPHHVEDKITFDGVPPSHPVVEVDRGARPVVAYVPAQHVVARDRLVVARHLLPIDPDIVHVIRFDHVVAREAPGGLVRRVAARGTV